MCDKQPWEMTREEFNTQPPHGDISTGWGAGGAWQAFERHEMFRAWCHDAVWKIPFRWAVVVHDHHVRLARVWASYKPNHYDKITDISSGAFYDNMHPDGAYAAAEERGRQVFFERDLPWQRKWVVEDAVRSGKPVPPEVLADYPRLQPKKESTS